jgi:FMN-dependent NADH-azoreductase
MTLFRLDASIRPEGSVSRDVADTVQSAWMRNHPDDTVVRRDLTADPLPSDAWMSAASATGVPEEEWTPEQRSALELAATLADEVLAGDAAVIASPLYNFGVSQHLKTWIDLLITDPRFGPGAQPLAGRPLTVVMARGGGYGEGTPREGWDHATPYLRRIFADAFGADVTVVVAELTLADVVPAMAELRPIAAESRAEAHKLAEATGRAHAERVRSATRSTSAA